MTGASLSRWTMTYFAVAIAALLGAEALMATGYGFPGYPVQAPETLVLVHLAAIGWLSLLMMGALIQFVPVLVSQPLAYSNLPGVALAFLVLGLAALILGFLGMAGAPVGPWPWLPSGAICLALGFTLNIWNLGRTIASARHTGLPARFVVVGLASLAATILFGGVFTAVLGGWTADPLLARLTSEGVPVHAALGLGGWLTFTAMGVSYRLLAMFMLSPEAEHRTSRAAFWAGTAAITALFIGAPVCILLLGRGPAHTLGIALVLGTAVVTLYGFDVIRLYRQRKRPHIELNARMAAWALVVLGIGYAFLLVLTGVGEIGNRIGAIAFLFAFGWLSGLGLAKLYKIVAFLTWLECYGPLLGKRQTPRVQDLANEKRALPWFQLYFACTTAAFLALLLGAPTVFRFTALGMLIATFQIGVQFISVRKLRYVPAAMLPQSGEPRPRLFLPSVQHSPS